MCVENGCVSIFGIYFYFLYNYFKIEQMSQMSLFPFYFRQACQLLRFLYFKVNIVGFCHLESVYMYHHDACHKEGERKTTHTHTRGRTLGQ